MVSNFRFVPLAEFVELRDARHGAVVVHDFADDASGLEAGDAGEIDGSFRLASANEDAAVARAQRKNMAGAREVFGARFGIDGGEDGDGAVGGADAGGDAAARVDGFAEGGAESGRVAWRHGSEIQRVAALLGEREADQAAAVCGHEIDGFGRDFFGGHGEIAFVFAVFVVDDDDHAALANFFDGFLDCGEGGLQFSHRAIQRDACDK